ncbi:flagellar basal body-associated FliL family protein [Mesorhizobium sp. A623]
MATVEQAPSKNGPSTVVQVAMLAAMTVAALGIGWLSGSYLKSSEAPPSVKPATERQEDDKAGSESHGPDAAALLVELAPITTNLASPDTVWVRLDASIVFDAPQPPEMARAVHEDLLAFVRTLKLHQIEGASGYQHLKADLQERASIRSGGHVKAVLIRTLLFE